MARLDLLVPKVKRAFPGLLEEKDSRAPLASLEPKVTRSNNCPLVLSLQTYVFVFNSSGLCKCAGYPGLKGLYGLHGLKGQKGLSGAPGIQPNSRNTQSAATMHHDTCQSYLFSYKLSWLYFTTPSMCMFQNESLT